MAQVTLLDGAIGQELVTRAGERATPLWSTKVMIEHPKMVGEVHLDYFAAGATVATTNTYCVLPDRLDREGIGDRLEELLRTAVMAARRARAAHGRGRVAGSLGPLVASYRPDLVPAPDEAAARYAEVVALMRDEVDLLLIETMSSVAQAEGALMAATGQGVPVWLALTVEDEDGTRLRSGEGLGEIAPLLERFEVEAVLINCSRPEAVAAGLPILAEFGLPFGAYANGFTRIDEAFLTERPTVDALEARSDLDPAAYAEFAMGWVEAGARIVGGCCEVGPAHIAELARRLRAAGHEIV
ncbi:homocysteine S-methyltransferase family protein [Roseovarius sp. SCSIO 43702]|uniref:homocysteine S-methyltransferase family protein n=1 Tax=Roseovarius sp. SCSIO 43702 TaxID=2823043 RepID=UPI001C7372FF|nr:homocysteine S-methyltransferase family protein [Roseovarius sp. SCSIO 43702]QYX56467.1 homocysteine S-methyltransferase family protein [Roseovarius sp. SCSIO 43702]